MIMLCEIHLLKQNLKGPFDIIKCIIMRSTYVQANSSEEVVKFPSVNADLKITWMFPNAEKSNGPPF